jgi:hypothetical protein
MTISKLKTLGNVALACGLAPGGAPALTLGHIGFEKERPAAAAVVRSGDDPHTVLGRSLDKLESDWGETARRNAEMQEGLQAICAELQALSEAARPGAATEVATPFAGVLEQSPALEVARLADQLKRHPVQPKEAPDRVGLYMMDLKNEEVTLIADQPVTGLTHSGSPAWSHDGRRIFFDASPGTNFNRSRLMAIEIRDGRLSVTDVGPGNCPTFSPDDTRVAFLVNPGAVPGSETGVWLMNADGSQRRLLGDYGKPLWSPDGRQLLVMSFTFPREIRLMDANPEKSSDLKVPVQQIHSDPSWAGEGTNVAVIGPAQGDSIALVDVSEPLTPKVKEILWRTANGPDVLPDYPVYSPATGRCIFVGIGKDGESLYSIQKGKTPPAKRLGPQRREPKITTLACSPDGRYLLYSIRGPGPAPAGSPAGRK